MAILNLKEYYKETIELLNDGKLEESKPRLDYLIDVYPDDAFLLFQLGSYYSKTEQFGKSMMAYEKSIRLNPNLSEAYNNVAGSYRKYRMIDRARETFLKAIEIVEKKELSKNYTKEDKKRLLCDYYGNLGSTYISEHGAKEGLKYFNKALSINAESQNAKWNKGLALLELGEYEEGFKLYDFGKRIDKESIRDYKESHKKGGKIDWWDGTKGQTVVVYGEQGIGDEIMFASLLPELARDCKKVIFDCHERLLSMFRNSFPYIDCYGTRKHEVLHWVKNYQIDSQIAIGSLPKFYRSKKSDFPGVPYLLSDDRLNNKILSKLLRLKHKINIGISWKGGTRETSKSYRTIDLQDWMPFFEEFKDKANFISLQYHDNARYEIDQFQEKNLDKEITIHHWQKELDDYDLTAALVNKLDFIVSVPQSVVHLSGAMGRKVYQLCPYKHMWQMGVYGEDLPWYNSVTNIWQDSHNDWKGCINKAINKIKEDMRC